MQLIFGSANVTKKADSDKRKYIGYGITFDFLSEISFTDKRMGKNVFFFCSWYKLSVHIDNKGKYILIFGEEPTQGLDDTILTGEAIYHTNFTQTSKRFVWSLHHNESNSFLFVNATKLY